MSSSDSHQFFFFIFFRISFLKIFFEWIKETKQASSEYGSSFKFNISLMKYLFVDFSSCGSFLLIDFWSQIISEVHPFYDVFALCFFHFIDNQLYVLKIQQMIKQIRGVIIMNSQVSFFLRNWNYIFKFHIPPLSHRQWTWRSCEQHIQ